MHKLLDKKGETLLESLASLLLACLAILMLLGYVNVSKNLIKKSDDKMDAYYEANNALNLKEEADGKGIITFSRAIVPDKTNIEVEYYINDTYEKNKVVAFEIKKE